MKRVVRFVFSIIVISAIPFCFFGCDRPEKDPGFYGELQEHLPELPEAKASFEVPDLKDLGVDESSTSP